MVPSPQSGILAPTQVPSSQAVRGWPLPSQVSMKCPEAGVPISSFQTQLPFPAVAPSDTLGPWGAPQTSCVQASCLQPHCAACWGCLPWSSGEDWAGRARTTSLPNRLILLLGFHSLPIVTFLLGPFPPFLKELCQGTCVAFPTAWVREHLSCTTECLTEENPGSLVFNCCPGTELEYLMPFQSWVECFYLDHSPEVRPSTASHVCC